MTELVVTEAEIVEIYKEITNKLEEKGIYLDTPFKKSLGWGTWQPGIYFRFHCHEENGEWLPELEIEVHVLDLAQLQIDKLTECIYNEMSPLRSRLDKVIPTQLMELGESLPQGHYLSGVYYTNGKDSFVLSHKDIYTISYDLF